MKRLTLIAIACVLSACSREVQSPAAADETLQAPAPRLTFVSESSAEIKRNGTLSQLLRGEKVDRADEWIKALATACDLRKLRAGNAVRFYRNVKDGLLAKIVIERSDWERAVVTSDMKARMEQDATTVTTELLMVEVESSLYQSLQDGGYDPSIAFELSEVFAWDLDFYVDVQKGDRVLALVDVRRRAGSNAHIAYGTMHGAIYDGQAGRFHAFRYNNSFFDENGRSLKKEFLKSPLKFAHVTSRFGSRRHPVLGYTRQHQGVDFAASVGTPVWAIGDGRVTYAGWQGGYGKFVTVRHPNGFESAYAHLSAINVKVGQHVAQKSVVGMSGNTGLSSGPHLHFGLRRGGTFINPFSLKPERVEPLANEELPRFKESIDVVQKRLGEALQTRT